MTSVDTLPCNCNLSLIYRHEQGSCDKVEGYTKAAAIGLVTVATVAVALAVGGNDSGKSKKKRSSK